MKNNTILLTGGSHAEMPLITALQELGYYVITTGNNTDGLGHKLADEYVPGDFSDREFVYQLAKERKVAGIVSGCNDFAYLSSAYACEKLNFAGHDSYETACQIHQKNRFRQILEQLSLNCPKNQFCESFEETLVAAKQIGYPLLIKPVDLTGGKGVKVCYNENEMKDAFHEATRVTRQKGIILEEFIQGENHGLSCLLKNQKVEFIFWDNEEYYLNKYLVSGANSWPDIPREMSERVKNDIGQIATHCHLSDGLFHCQTIVKADGQVYLIDPCRRAPGDLYVDLVSLSSGIDYAKAIVLAELGIDFSEDIKNPYESFRYVARECIMTDENGIYKSVQIPKKYQQKMVKELIWAKENEPIEDYQKYKAGILFFAFASSKEMEEYLRDLYKNVVIVMKKLDEKQ